MSESLTNVRVQTMMKFFLIAGVLFVFCSLFATIHPLDPYAVGLLPVPVAIYAARRRMDLAFGLVAICGLGAAATGRGVQGGLQYALVAMAGVPIGIGVVRHWTYGRTLAAAASTAALAVIGGVLANWREWLGWSRIGYDDLTTRYHNRLTPEMIEQVQWLRDHWAEVGVGMQFALVLFCSLGAMGMALAVLRRRYQVVGINGSFRVTRLTEWLVWVAIAVAGLWFADRYWPETGLRVFAWNAAIGMAALYWLNGLSVLFYGLDALRLGFLGYLGVVLLLVSFAFYPVCLIGLFDTWGHFRGVFDRIAAERKRREQAEQTDDK